MSFSFHCFQNVALPLPWHLACLLHFCKSGSPWVGFRENAFIITYLLEIGPHYVMQAGSQLAAVLLPHQMLPLQVCATPPPQLLSGAFKIEKQQKTREAYSQVRIHGQGHLALPCATQPSWARVKLAPQDGPAAHRIPSHLSFSYCSPGPRTSLVAVY